MKTLFTDMDGTFIPGDSDSLNALKKIKERREFDIVYVTGRNREEVLQVIKEYDLPKADGIIGDVGSSIYKRFLIWYFESKGYRRSLDKLLMEDTRKKLINSILEFDGIRLQETNKQGRYKISFYFDYKKINITKSIYFGPWEPVISRDHNGVGLLDLLPKGVNKLSSILWYMERYGINPGDALFAGDSGNDLKVFLSDINSIVVSNTRDEIIKAVKGRDNVFIASKSYTTGVLEGLNFYGFYS